MTSEERKILQKVISGGQTGVDRGALDAAIDVGIEHGGACPKGRLAEDGSIPTKYRLRELPSRKYSVRTEQNVIDADATLIVHNGSLSGGTAFTHRMAVKNGRPFMLYDITNPPELDEVIFWLAENEVATLNCAGPRESANEGIESISKKLFREIFSAALGRI